VLKHATNLIQTRYLQAEKANAQSSTFSFADTKANAEKLKELAFSQTKKNS